MSVLQSLAFAVILIVHCSVGTVTVQSEAFGSAGKYREGEQLFQKLTHLRQRRQAGGENSTVFKDPIVTLINRQNESRPLPPESTTASSTVVFRRFDYKTSSSPNKSYVENATETSTVALTHVEASCNSGALVGVALACLLIGCLVTLLVQILVRINGHPNQGRSIG